MLRRSSFELKVSPMLIRELNNQSGPTFGAIVLFTALIYGGPAALAQTTCAPTQDPNVCVSVSAAPSVTFSQPGSPTFVTYVVSIENRHSNVLNRVRFGGTVVGTTNFVNPATGQPVFASNPTAYPAVQTGDVPLTCNLMAAAVIECSGDGTFGVSVPPGQRASINLMVETPYVLGVPIVFTWNASFAEGNSSSGSANNGTALGSSSTLLTTPGSTVAADLPASGGSLTATSGEFITTATITQAGRTTSVNITQSKNPTSAVCRSFKTCYASAQTIPGTFDPPLKFTLQMDAANIKRGTKIESVDIRYTGADINNTTVANWPVPMCLVSGVPRDDGLPCISTRTFFKNSRVPGWTIDRDGDFLWEIISTKNGTFEFF
jgi:hypothetical protein